MYSFCELDALVYGHIRAILTTPVPVQNNAFGFVVGKFKNLIKHVKKIDKYVMDCSTDFTVYPYKMKVLIAKNLEASYPFPFVIPILVNPSYPLDPCKIENAYGSW